ncbi:exodeoxyribonuclease VII large subunit [Desulforegula conservatrix]|uniref:exodeoxyribonuclease VII large subunit n=1 Tax=Desulforegula conservatrix TaxID=153026 RepID=UPI00041E4FA7|nr:exodeoxyribonuclease VII large subunit [Desulforegula conservatrix]
MIHRDVPGGLPTRTVLTVTNLTLRIKSLLEESFSFVWVEGEISNLRIPTSGHYYFTVKDSNAQIAAVMFKGQVKSLKFALKDGIAITGLGRISVYEPRGSYQIIFEYLEPKGAGSLQLAFEQLKEKLAGEGLFDQSRKKPLPFLPSKISVITSPSGAVIRDIITVSKRRFPSVRIEVVPSTVQGDAAVPQLVSAIELVNKIADSDIIIIARGGGSIEDLSAFNSEELARAVAASVAPVISAVGHETDFTICDFVADLRAPTPSAAAEIALPDIRDLERLGSNYRNRLINSTLRQIGSHRTHYRSLCKRLVDPRKKIQDLILRCDDLTARLHRAGQICLDKRKSKIENLKNRLMLGKFVSDIRSLKYRKILLAERLKASIMGMVKNKKSDVARLGATLEALSPVAVLSRGYSITRTMPDKKIILKESEVMPGQLVETILASGRIVSKVEGKEE